MIKEWQANAAAQIVGALAGNPNGGLTPDNVPGLLGNVLGALSGPTATGAAPAAPAKRGAQQQQQQAQPPTRAAPTQAPAGKAKRGKAVKQAA